MRCDPPASSIPPEPAPSLAPPQPSPHRKSHGEASGTPPVSRPYPPPARGCRRSPPFITEFSPKKNHPATAPLAPTPMSPTPPPPPQKTPPAAPSPPASLPAS